MFSNFSLLRQKKLCSITQFYSHILGENHNTYKCNCISKHHPCISHAQLTTLPGETMTPNYMKSCSSKHSIFLRRRSPKIRIIQSIFLVFHLSSELYDMKKFYYFVKIKNVVSEPFPRVCYVAFYLFISVIGKWTFDKKT